MGATKYRPAGRNWPAGREFETPCYKAWSLRLKFRNAWIHNHTSDTHNMLFLTWNELEQSTMCPVLWTITRADILFNITQTAMKQIRANQHVELCFLCAVVCWWLYVCVCRMDSTTHWITSRPPAPSHRVINNWPFVPFLPRLFLFSPPLSIVKSPIADFIFHSTSHPPLLLTSTSLLLVLSIIHPSLSLLSLLLSFSQTPTLSSCSFLWHTPSAHLSLSRFASKSVRVETLCPTFT